MGNCCSRPHEMQERQRMPTATPLIGTNLRLKPFETYVKSVPITSELVKERQTFWDTQPSYSGRLEVWQLLRLAVETNDLSTAQVLVDSAELTFPTGRFTDGCYDTLGNHYVIPAYCIGPLGELRITEEKTHIQKQASMEVLEDKFEAVFRLSTGTDLRLLIAPGMSVNSTKKSIAQNIGLKDTSSIMLLYFGKVLEDGVKIRETKIDGTSLVQAMILQK